MIGFYKQIKNIEEFITEEIKEDIFANIDTGKVLMYTTDKYFIKVAKPKEIYFRESLKNDITNSDYLESLDFNVPKTVYRHTSRDFFIKIEELLPGKPLACHRNDFELNQTVDVKKVVTEISRIRETPINKSLTKDYTLDDKIDNYIYKIQDLLPEVLSDGLVARLEALADRIEEFAEVEWYLSHGDTIPRNILNVEGEFYFIDWEWCGLRDKMYDTVLFLLFTELPNNAVKKFSNYISDDNIISSYIDAVVISLKEIKNWAMVQDETVRDKHIEYWLETLEFALVKIENSPTI